jgi:hypothetical protein
MRSSPVIRSLRQRDEQGVELLPDGVPRVFGILPGCEYRARCGLAAGTGVTYSGCDAASRLNNRECTESRNPDKDSGVW